VKTRFAFAGFRHGHIFDLLAGVREREDCEIVACCEEDAATRNALAGDARVEISHSRFTAMLRDVPCDAVAVGDYYARRGSLVIEALRAGKHVIADKPLCTTLAEQAEIETLAAERGLCVALQFDCRGAGPFIAMREIIRSGELGDVCAVNITAQHPLQLDVRPAWYFEPGKHGGTINDIGIHAFDLVPWLTGIAWKRVTAARCWNAKARAFPHFQDGAQFLAELTNGAGVIADLSYFAPDKIGAQLPHYWRIGIHGTRGFAETNLRADHVAVTLDASEATELRPIAAPLPRRYLADFLHEVRGRRELCDLTTADSLAASRRALEAQASSTGS
jgi:predicted dehydrogenase